MISSLISGILKPGIDSIAPYVGLPLNVTCVMNIFRTYYCGVFVGRSRIIGLHRMIRHLLLLTPLMVLIQVLVARLGSG